jgi:PAS domain S-box-containing protein
MENPPAFPNSDSSLPDAFPLLMESIQDYAIIVMDLSGIVLDWNTGAARMFGYDRAEMPGKDAKILLSQEGKDGGVMERELDGALSNSRGGEESWYLRKDGSRFWGSSAVYALSRHGGDPVGFVKIMRDAGAQRESADALSESERRMDFVLENLKDHAIFLINHEGLITSWNKGTERVFGYHAEDMLGRPFASIFTPEDALAGIPDRELIVARSAGKAEDERWHQRKDGSRFWASGAVLPVNGNREKSDFIKILRDATDRKRSEDADRMESIGRLAGGAAHDYNNMLTSIIGYCELMIASTSGDEREQRWLGEILTSANRAANLTRDLLSFSRKQMIAPERISLNDIILKMSGLLRTTLGGQVQLNLVLDPQLEQALLDKGQIEQVLLNLALNAREAMPDGGEVTLTTVSAGATGRALAAASAAASKDTATGESLPLGAASAAIQEHVQGGKVAFPGSDAVVLEPGSTPFVTLIFKDNGKGMDAETAAHAFDPFFSTKSKATGSVGLGLSTTYGIIQQSGGTISLASVPGTGTEFEIRFPVFNKAEANPLESGAMQPSVPVSPTREETRKECILVVEDEAAVRNLVSEILGKKGFRILEAKDGEEGLALFTTRGSHIDLVLSDVLMPKLGGVAMARRIHEIRSDVPIVFMSGYSENAASALDKERRGPFLQKPFSIANLISLLDKALEKRTP